MVRVLGVHGLAELYKARIRRDFPRNERRPLFLIRSLNAKDNYRCLVLEEKGERIAYATFLCDAGLNSVLLDYFAVNEELRGQGVGSRFLHMLREYWSDKDGIIIECEKPDAAKRLDERQTRERRIRFYTNAGAAVTPLYWRVFGVDYNVLWLPILENSHNAAISENLTELYIISMPKVVRRSAKAFLQKRRKAPSGD